MSQDFLGSQGAWGGGGRGLSHVLDQTRLDGPSLHVPFGAASCTAMQTVKDTQACGKFASSGSTSCGMPNFW